MKQITESTNKERWPRKQVASVEARKRDLIVRVSDWSKDRDEPAFDVEVYIGGVYDYNESKVFAKSEHGDLATCKRLAAEFAAAQIAKLL